MNPFIRRAPHFIFNVLSISLLLLCIEIIKNYDPTLLGVFGFVSGSFFFIQLLQYSYIYNRANAYTDAFLKHSILGYGVAFLLCILFYLTFVYTSLSPLSIILVFSSLNMVIWLLYVFYCKSLF